MTKNKKKILNLKKIKKCPICESKSLFVISNIKSKIKDIGSKFNLIKCTNCSHRLISKIPKEKFLKDLYINDSPLVFGGAHSELKLKKDFMDGNFEKVEPYKNHWVFNYISDKICS